MTASICIRGWRRDTLPRAIESVLAQGRDDDDRLLPGYLDATIGRLDDDPAVGIVFTNYVRAAWRASPGPPGERELVALRGARQMATRLLARHPRLVRPAFSAWRVLRRLDRFG